MKTLFQCGLCLVLGMWISRAAADELQWRKASPSGQAASSDAPGSSAPSVRLMPAVPLNQQADSDSFATRPATVRAQKNDDDIKPLPQHEPALPPSAPKVTVTPLVPSSPASSDPAPVQTSPPPTGQKIETWEEGSHRTGSAQPPTERIPVEPTPLSPSPLQPGQGATIVGPCDCGLSSHHLLKLDGCGSCFDAHPSFAPCDSCDSCCCYNSNRTCMWVSGEFLYWAFSKPNAPPLVTLGTTGVGTTTATGGTSITGPALGLQGTQVLYGGDTFNTDAHSGGRLTIGFWCPRHEDWGVEFSGMYLASNTTTFRAGNGADIIGRPFLDVTPGSFVTDTGLTPFQSTQLVNDPGVVTGSVRVDYTSQLWGADANLVYKLCCRPNFRLNLLLGYRYLSLDESISITEDLNAGDLSLLVNDRFATHNSFHGGQIGFDGELRFCKRWFVGGTVKLAVGDVMQSANISGTQVVGGTIVNSGVFANSSTNAGVYSRNAFGFVPEGTFKLGVDVTDHLRLFVGYNILYLSNAVRAGDAIDPTINTSFQTGGAPNGTPRPAFIFRNSTFMAHGVTAGLEYHY